MAADTAITAALQDAPDATHLVLPYSIGISAVIEAVRKAGKTEDVKVMTKDGDELGLLAVANGGSSANAGVSLEWVAWAGLDQAIRGLTDNEYLPPEELGLGAHSVQCRQRARGRHRRLGRTARLQAEVPGVVGSGQLTGESPGRT